MDLDKGEVDLREVTACFWACFAYFFLRREGVEVANNNLEVVRQELVV